MSQPPRARTLQAVVAAVALTWTATASATPDFPGVVTQVYSLPGITIDPPMGCMLCHTSDTGGKALRPFGSLLQSYGAVKYNEGSLRQALALVAQGQPQLIADIKAGRDPNNDSSAGLLPSPEYGCAVGRVLAQPIGSGTACAAGVFFLLVVRRRRS